MDAAIPKSAFVLCLAFCASRATWAEPAPLVLESTISLGQVEGRIDHLAVDLRRQRLYVAELGNDTAAVVDLKTARLLQTITGLNEPQGMVYVAATDELYVANGGDGSVRIFRGADLAPVVTIALDGDADNLRVDGAGRHVLAGHGNGGLAMIDVTSRRVEAEIPLRGHPEGFQLSPDGRRAFVNIPGKREVAVVDLSTRRRVESWPARGLQGNFPMALESAGTGLWTAFRNPPRLVHFDAAGKATLTLQTCSDSDDLFLDEPRHRLYVICGSGNIEVREQGSDRHERIANITTAPGARTGLFVPTLDRLYVATRSGSGSPAKILVFRPD